MWDERVLTWLHVLLRLVTNNSTAQLDTDNPTIKLDPNVCAIDLLLLGDHLFSFGGCATIHILSSIVRDY